MQINSTSDDRRPIGSVSSIAHSQFICSNLTEQEKTESTLFRSPHLFQDKEEEEKTNRKTKHHIANERL